MCESNSNMGKPVESQKPIGLEEMDSENKPVEWDHLGPSLKALLPSERASHM